jgi:hypothetical protein
MHHLPSRTRRSAAVLSIVALAAFGAGAGPASAGDRSVDPTTLTPAPPDFFNAVCARTGSQIQCDLAFVDPVQPVLEPTGILCGSGAGAFEVLDTSIRTVTGKRYYSADGLLLRRHFDDSIHGTWTNSVTGATVTYEQHDTTLHDLAVPGDVQTGTEAQTTHVRLMTPHGSVVLESGRAVLDHASESFVFAAGHHAFGDYFDNGNRQALQPVCDALS